ncbi:soluble lytic murein transglycosylase-like protein [Ancylobacter polymorphus]|uniref:Soluble lytic murein transglycosylase-like protein n=1 Tax=Ancylobacter polymorphus TaxID=223390 RepID=A0ABU0B8R4_9HYPH|nr:transglycosylase SLT domain-containing protein [Ancylobacter polymorphus]MDQ0302217.1 soluble lytic murein transglycosylase-like protein [Ancylobacter polymorphus]
MTTRPAPASTPLTVASLALLAGGMLVAAVPASAATKKNAPVRTVRVVAVTLARVVPPPVLAPVPRCPADLVAPSYSAWITDPARGALTGERLVVHTEAVALVAVTPSETSPATTAPSPPAAPLASAAAPPASAAAPADTPAPAAALPAIPVPPKRLAEKRGIVLASLVPLPPSRPSEPLAFAAPPSADSPAFPAAEAKAGTSAKVPAEAVAEAEVEPLPEGEDAARPIDDTPEPVATRATADRAPDAIEALLERHAQRFDVPVWLVRRVAWRESKFEPSRRNGPYWGLMQIRVDTARALGFRGTPKDLLDADTNLTYAVAYLANAYRVAGRDEKRAVMLYARGYYYEAKRKKMLDSLIRTASATPAQTGDAAEPAAP